MRQTSEEAILQAALKVFSEKGFHRATNKDVAAAAGIASPGLIYHYFKDKHDLLRAVMMRQVSHSVVGPESIWMALPLKEGLLQLARSFLAMVDDSNYQRLARIALAEALTNQEFARTVFAMGPQKVFLALDSFFASAIESGEIDTSHVGEEASALTHLFLGPLIKAMLQRVIFGYQDSTSIDDAAAVHVEVFLYGCRKR
jgi:TetR/AcrR family transcriptional regulator, mexJK operon transcriptional repressor